MRRIIKISGNRQSLKTAFIFIILVVVLIFISLVFKIIYIINQSKFDGLHRFTIGIYNNSSKINVISFSPDKHSISFLEITSKGDKENLKDFNITKNLAIPIDGVVKYRVKKEKIDSSVDSQMTTIFLNFRNVGTNLTIIDIARLWYLSRTIPNRFVSLEKIDLSKDTISNKISSIFIDNIFLLEKNSIQVINGTDVSGLGNRLARVITNMGGNVISIITSEEEIENSEILYIGEKTYTAEKLSKILGFKTSKIEMGGISDITIKIGKDSLSELKF